MPKETDSDPAYRKEARVKQKAGRASMGHKDFLRAACIETRLIAMHVASIRPRMRGNKRHDAQGWEGMRAEGWLWGPADAGRPGWSRLPLWATDTLWLLINAVVCTDLKVLFAACEIRKRASVNQSSLNLFPSPHRRTSV